MPVDGVYVSPSGIKTFIPLENNADVFTTLAHDLGVSKRLAFTDVYSLDDADLLALVPRPALALIFIAPGSVQNAVRAADGLPADCKEITYDVAGDDERVVWFRQTIGNACGLMALLHSVATREARVFVEKDSALDKLLDEVKHLKPHARARAVYDNHGLEEAHMRAARTGDSAAPPAADFVPFHFIAFVKGVDNHLWELEGNTDGPLDRGELGAEDDMLSDKALDLGVKRFIKKAGENPMFSIVALSQMD